ncbi:MAG: cytochrome c maturation protein CcmE [Actinobacteria bacterium]|nr:cytochrome c maturation protein CcmE [Actinomycetota bacterium]
MSSRKQSPARLVIALSVAGCLAIFLLYTSIAGGGTSSLRPSQLAGREGKEVQLAGLVLAPVRGDAHAGGLRFRLRDIDGRGRVPVVYEGSVPDLFKVGRHVYLTGTLRKGVFVGERGTLVTKCPSKYAPKRS